MNASAGEVLTRAKHMDAVNKGFMYLTALLGLDWTSRFEKRWREIEELREANPEILSADEAISNLEQLQLKFQARIEDAKTGKQNAADAYDQALREGDETSITKWREILHARSDLLSYSERELTAVEENLSREQAKRRELEKRISKAHAESVTREYQAKHAEQLEHFIELIDTIETREALTELAVLAEVKVKLANEAQMKATLRHILAD